MAHYRIRGFFCLQLMQVMLRGGLRISEFAVPQRLEKCGTFCVYVYAIPFLVDWNKWTQRTVLLHLKPLGAPSAVQDKLPAHVPRGPISHWTLCHDLFPFCPNPLLVVCSLFSAKLCSLFKPVHHFAVSVESIRHEMATPFSTFPCAATKPLWQRQRCRYTKSQEIGANDFPPSQNISVQTSRLSGWHFP
jgi:hypothetical protein